MRLGHRCVSTMGLSACCPKLCWALFDVRAKLLGQSYHSAISAQQRQRPSLLPGWACRLPLRDATELPSAVSLKGMAPSSVAATHWQNQQITVYTVLLGWGHWFPLQDWRQLRSALSAKGVAPSFAAATRSQTQQSQPSSRTRWARCGLCDCDRATVASTRCHQMAKLTSPQQPRR
jgi:hypothetical protein